MKAKITVEWDSETGDYEAKYRGDHIDIGVLQALMIKVAAEMDQWIGEEEKDNKRPPWLS